ncbi:MAG TPA: hypothetical protein VKQ71_03710 [Acidimicrobiales bacterium]|nr:hypothetical protein [Acidimicrobiales bacterium]
MSASRHKSSRGRRRSSSSQSPVDFWRPTPQVPEPAPVAPPSDATALLRSLGDPPLPGQGAAAEHYLAVVVQRAAGLAVALAATAGLLAEPDDD